MTCELANAKVKIRVWGRKLLEKLPDIQTHTRTKHSENDNNEKN